MSKHTRILLAALLVVSALFVACKGEEEYAEAEAFSFVVYPGARYMGQLTENFKAAHRVISPTQEAPPTAVYDTDAPLEQVADYYVKQYGYKEIAADATNNVSGTKPSAYHRSGDLAVDTKAIEGLLKQMNLATDTSKAVGTYKGVEIAPRPNRPRVTLQRPYFDVTTSQVVDRTLILMAR
ncbi:MAG TPA: hypothetical protein VGQ76_01385 [Thermoanaerobaculia bacterium]|nr:hypothetical protein [Thermoanaerobaculia bacterium]